MEWNKNNLLNVVKFINNELKSGKPMIKVEKESFGENERVIHKRLIRLGYKKIDNQYIMNKDIKSNITEKVFNKENSIDTRTNDEKFSLLLENLDKLLLLLDNNSSITSNIAGIRSNITDVRSFRIDMGIYGAIKKLASERGENIGEIINIALERYLNENL